MKQEKLFYNFILQSSICDSKTIKRMDVRLLDE